MKTTYSDDTAFPVAGEQLNDAMMGLTKREYFAGLAMQGIISDPELADTPPGIAKSAVLYADALILELAKETDANG